MSNKIKVLTSTTEDGIIEQLKEAFADDWDPVYMEKVEKCGDVYYFMVNKYFLDPDVNEQLAELRCEKFQAENKLEKLEETIRELKDAVGEVLNFLVLTDKPKLDHIGCMVPYFKQGVCGECLERDNCDRFKTQASENTHVKKNNRGKRE